MSGASEDIERLRERFRGALLGVAVGDALGAAQAESAKRDGADLAAWLQHPPAPLRYTGDTHLTLAAARSLIACRGFGADHMGESLAAQLERAPWRDRTAAPPRVLDHLREGEGAEDAARELLDGAGSVGNGAALRAAPIGMAYCQTPERAAEKAREAARITHAHPLGEDGAALQAAAVAEILSAEDGQPAELSRRLRRYVRTRWFGELLERVESLAAPPPERVVESLGNGIEAHRSVPTALHCFLRQPGSFADAVLFALSLGGEAGAIASMTGALAGASLGASAIPAAWAGLEGREELFALADELLHLSARPGALKESAPRR